MESAVAKQRENDLQKLMDIRKQALNSEVKQEAYVKALKQFVEKWKQPKSNDELNTSSTDVSIQGSGDTNVLYVNRVGQETTYYCGPASAYQLLDYEGVSSNPHDGRSLTQSNLADDLGTTTNGTPFGDNWEDTLHDWDGAYWFLKWGADESYLMGATIQDVDADYPLIYDTHMTSSNGYLPGYSSGEIYHYVTGDGYDDPDNQIHYMDPNRYRDDAWGAHWVSLSLMTDVCSDRGIIW